MIKRTLTLVAAHGDTDRAKVEAWWNENQMKLKLVDGHHKIIEHPGCDVTLVYADAKNENRVEVHITDWAEVPPVIKDQIEVTIV